jgi:hypothetical protein
MLRDYKKIFWGIFIATFNVTIGEIRILPAFVGWIIVAIAISNLEARSNQGYFEKSRLTGIALVIVTLVGSLFSFFGGTQFEGWLPLVFYPVLVSVIELVVFHGVLEATIHHLDALNHKEIAEKYAEKDRIYIILMGITMSVVTLSLVMNHEMMGAIGVIAFIISRIYLLVVMNALSKEKVLGL